MKLTVKSNPTVLLELSGDEAGYLRRVCARIGGGSPARRFFDVLAQQLADVGIQARGEFEPGHQDALYFLSEVE